MRTHSEENMAAALARRVSGMYIQFDFRTFSFQSPYFVNVKFCIHRIRTELMSEQLCVRVIC